jgi:hypothetical protein
VVRATGARFSLNMFSAVSAQGALRFMVHEGTVNATGVHRLLQTPAPRRRRPGLPGRGRPPRAPGPGHHRVRGLHRGPAAAVPAARYAAGDEAQLAKETGSRPGAVLIAWHHEALHRIAYHLDDVHPRPPRGWPPDRFDLVWTFTPDGHGWRFAQIPQLLLPGDLPHPITDYLTAAES